jgi:hypothetical protein
VREYRRAWRLSTARRRRSTGPALHDREASDGYAATAGDSSSARSAAPLGDLDLISRQRSKQRGIKVTVLRAGAQKMSANSRFTAAAMPWLSGSPTLPAMPLMRLTASLGRSTPGTKQNGMAQSECYPGPTLARTECPSSKQAFTRQAAASFLTRSQFLFRLMNKAH